MKPLKFTLGLLASLALGACSASDPAGTQPTEPASTLTLRALPVAGESLKPVVINTLKGYLITSEAEGLIWASPEGQQISGFTDHIAQADWRLLPGSDNTIAIAAIDQNTSALHLVTLDTATGEFLLQTSLPSAIADRETLCLSRQDDTLHLFSSDARGLMSHYLLNTGENWQLTPIRQMMVGPDLSSCAVADENNSLLIAEEGTGIWHYSGNAEGENARNLDYFSTGPELESVAALADGRYFVVATDQPFIYERGQRNRQWPLATARELKSVSAAVAGDTLYLGAFDEASGELLAATLNDTAPASKATRKVYTLSADVQTAPVNRYGDAADDPAIWVNRLNPAASLVLGTDKKYGLNVYSLKGEQLQSLPVGRVNNVDVRYQIDTPAGKQDIAVASNRSSQTLSVYYISATGKVTHAGELPTTLSDVYGLCSGVIDGQLHTFINDTDGRYQQYAFTFTGDGPSAELVGEFNLPSQPEGCVVDDAREILYMGEEAAGIWQKALSQPLSAPNLIASVGEEVEADIEGMGIYTLEDKRYLVVSSQGNSRFAVYALDDGNRLLGTFRIGINGARQIDGVSETDGLEVTSTALGPQFPDGLMVVQDGRNVMPTAPQNFKLISGTKLAEFIRQNR
ncbi:MAG: phytase [Pseudomonadota bacterium]|uniref:3-phytase n=1 Tax=Alteromonas alba TaxID=2079529 RepID=A0A2S9VH92_9ALTE|nr:phytase [Alteromonas alba]MDY6926256.1 phytase [Pseudomonadota bacterium]PRO75625.1 3-phytase [Alteromonas alba]